MNIKKERTHLSGLSNLDYRTKGDLAKVDHFQPNLKFSDFGTMNKTKYQRMPSAATFKEQVALSGGWQNSKYKNEHFKNSKYETANDFYKSKGKKWRGQVQIGKKVETELEANKWTDKVFTGDTNQNAAALTYYARQREMNNTNERYKGRQSTCDDAVGNRLLYQPGRYQPDKSGVGTLEGVVDLDKVRYIKRAIRRRYTSRTNVDSIFQQYDSAGKGYVNAQDL